MLLWFHILIFLTLVYFLLTALFILLMCSHLVNPDNGLVLLVPYPCSSVFVFYWVLLFVHIIPFLLFFFFELAHFNAILPALENQFARNIFHDSSFFLQLHAYLLIYAHYLHIGAENECAAHICEKAKGILLFHISSNCISCFKVHFMCASLSRSFSLYYYIAI